MSNFPDLEPRLELGVRDWKEAIGLPWGHPGHWGHLPGR